MDKIRVCAYTRVSTDSKDQENSFENQKISFERTLSNKDGYELINIYADKGLTGTQLHNRPEFKKMILDAGLDVVETKGKSKKHFQFEISDREPLFDEIWITNTSRFARNTFSFEIIELLLKKNVHIFFVQQNLNTKDVGSTFFLKLFQLFDEQYSRDLSVKVSAGHKEGARKGVVHVTSRIYGYKYVQEENRLEIISHEAEVIKKIYELYANKELGVRRIINELDKQGIKTRENKSFSSSTIKRILRNEKYAGINVRNKYDKGTVFNKNSYAKIRPRDEWVVEENSDKIPAIIDKEMFDNVQKIMNNRVDVFNNGKNFGKSELSGILKCGNCGSNYSRNKDRGKFFYNCTLKKTKGTKVCNNPNIQHTQIEGLFDLLHKHSMHLGMRHYYKTRKVELKKRKRQLERKLTKQDNSEFEKLTIELNKNLDIKNGLLDLYINGTFDKGELDKRRIEIDNRINYFQSQIDDFSKSNQDIIDEIKQLEIDIEELEELIEYKEYSREEILERLKVIEIKVKENEPKAFVDLGLFQVEFPLKELRLSYKE